MLLGIEAYELLKNLHHSVRYLIHFIERERERDRECVNFYEIVSHLLGGYEQLVRILLIPHHTILNQSDFIFVKFIYLK